MCMCFPVLSRPIYIEMWNWWKWQVWTLPNCCSSSGKSLEHKHQLPRLFHIKGLTHVWKRLCVGPLFLVLQLMKLAIISSTKPAQTIKCEGSIVVATSCELNRWKCETNIRRLSDKHVSFWIHFRTLPKCFRGAVTWFTMTRQEQT